MGSLLIRFIFLEANAMVYWVRPRPAWPWGHVDALLLSIMSMSKKSKGEWLKCLGPFTHVGTEMMLRWNHFLCLQLNKYLKIKMIILILYELHVKKNLSQWTDRNMKGKLKLLGKKHTTFNWHEEYNRSVPGLMCIS